MEGKQGNALRQGNGSGDLLRSVGLPFCQHCFDAVLQAHFAVTIAYPEGSCINSFWPVRRMATNLPFEASASGSDVNNVASGWCSSTRLLNTSDRAKQIGPKSATMRWKTRGLRGPKGCEEIRSTDFLYSWSDPVTRTLGCSGISFERP